MQKCYLALGCFWKPEETFRGIKSIVATEVDNAGGKDKKVTYDNIYFDIRRSKATNRRARYNIVFGDEEVTPSSDYKQHSVKAFSNVPKLNKVRKKLKKLIKL